jgi:hypothetical protein
MLARCRQCVCAAGVIAMLLAGCGGDAKAPEPRSGRSTPAAAGAHKAQPTAVSTHAFRPGRAAPVPALRPIRVATRDAFAFRAVADAGHVVWLTGPVEEEGVETALMQRDLRTGRTTILARGIDPHYGLAATGDWVVFTETTGSTRLLAMRHDGSGRTQLAASLVAPLAARGALVAWAERDDRSERVMVRDMATARQWVAAAMPACGTGRCYRVDSVTLADRGVVFTRVATDPDASRVVRRAFDARRSQRVKIPGDPQPELVPSSAGALYYVLGKGWYRWDFGRARPRRTRFMGDPPAPLLAYERGRWFLGTQRGCRAGVIERHRGRQAVIASPSSLIADVPTPHAGLCVQLGALTWTGRQPVTAWGVVPEESEEEHEEQGLVGFVSIGEPRRP